MSRIRRQFGRLIGWFRPPGLGSLNGHVSALQRPFHPETVSDLLDKSEQRRVELLGWSDRLDRKLLAVITADGVYAALLVSIRNLIPVEVVVLVGLLVFTSLGIAYLAWRPLGFRTVAVEGFVGDLDIHPDDLRRLLIAAHDAANRQILELNAWKAGKLSVAAGCFIVGALVAVGYTVLGGTL